MSECIYAVYYSFMLNNITVLSHTYKNCTYVGETGRTLKKRIGEYKAAVKKEDNKNRIAVHVKNTKHHIDWDGARVISNEMQYWRRRVVEAISIYTN